MKLKVDDNGNFLTIVDSTEIEYEQVMSSFTKREVNWGAVRYNNGKPKYFETKFVDRYGRIPLGLWGELRSLSKQFMFNVEIENIEKIYDKNYDETQLVEWVNTYFEESEKQPYDYQVEAISKALKYRNCIEEISTSGGKTLMAFMLFRYLMDKGIINKMLYVVPNIGLVTQTEEEFYALDDICGNKPKWKSACVYSGADKRSQEDANIIFGTFQSLAKKDLEYFSKFDAVFVDECHHSKATSIKNVLVKCYNAKYKIGMTGTLPKEGSLDSFVIQAYLGPCVYRLESVDLIESERATPINIIGLEMDYLDESTKKMLYDLRNVPTEEKDGVKLLNLEKDLVRENRKRLVYICNTILKATKNSLVLFSDIKNEYGRHVYNYLKEHVEGKEVYYLDGGTPEKNREFYKKQMEENDNVIIVASIGVFSEGINIPRLFNIFLTESNKSEFIIRQALGRGMRLLEGKDVVNVVDFRDNFVYGTHKYQRVNYLMRHAKAREQIYQDKKFPFKTFKVTF